MYLLQRMKIGGRLNAGFAVVLLVALAISLLAIWQLRTLAADNRTLLDVPLHKERLISDWYSKIDSAVRRTSAIAKSSDASLAAFFKEDGVISTKASADLQQQIASLVRGDAERALFAQVLEKRKVYLSSRDEITRLKTEGKVEEAARIFDQVFVPESRRYEELILDLQRMQRDEIDRTAREIADKSASSVRLLAGLTLAMVLLGALFAWWLRSGITRPLGDAVSAARKVASGDLTGRIDSTLADETGELLRSLKTMNASLADIVARVRAGTDNIVTGSSQIAAGNLDLSSRTEEQAAALGETACSMEELTSTVRQTADNARQAHELARDASTVAASGGTVVNRVIETMGAISASSQKIGDIIGVIDGIAFQTNILALNAAVEAARAGEQGRGFAVVASEVRGLAQRSATAAREIKELIGNATHTVAEGSTLVAEAGQTMVDIVSRVQRVAEIMSTILAATEAQSTGLGQVNDAISQMDQVTQQNAALVEEAAAAAGSLQRQAGELAATVSAFTLTSAQAG